MSRFNRKWAAVILLFAVLATTGSVFAAAVHQACIAPQHDCDQTPTIAECCCSASGTSHQATPAEQRVEITSASVLSSPVVASVDLLATSTLGAESPRSISPRLILLDLPTLFATLLI